MFISSITATMMEVRALTAQRRLKLRHLNRYLNSHHISGRLVAMMKRHINERRDEAREMLNDELEILDVLPTQLQHDLLLEVRGPLLGSHVLFRIYAEKH